MPRPTYRLAMETTSRRLASASRCLARSSPCRMRSASSISSSGVSRGTRPISFKYTLTGSSMATPSAARAPSNSSVFSSVSLNSSISGSGSSTTSMLWASSVSYSLST